MYVANCGGCRARGRLAGLVDFALQPFDDYPGDNGGGGGGGGGGFAYDPGLFIPPPTDTGTNGNGGGLGPSISPPIIVDPTPPPPALPPLPPGGGLFVECVPGYGWNGVECVPSPGGPSDPLAPTGGGSYTPGGSGPGTGYVPPTTTTDPAGGGQVVPQGQPATGPTHGEAAGPEVATAGAGNEMLGWLIGALISAALVSRAER